MKADRYRFDGAQPCHLRELPCDSKRDNADGGSFNQSQGYAQSFNQVPQQQPAYQAPQNVSAAPSDFSMLSDDDPDLPF